MTVPARQGSRANQNLPESGPYRKNIPQTRTGEWETCGTPFGVCAAVLFCQTDIRDFPTVNKPVSRGTGTKWRGCPVGAVSFFHGPVNSKGIPQDTRKRARNSGEAVIGVCCMSADMCGRGGFVLPASFANLCSRPDLPQSAHVCLATARASLFPGAGLARKTRARRDGS